MGGVVKTGNFILCKWNCTQNPIVAISPAVRLGHDLQKDREGAGEGRS